jgi:hypothetical protein
LDDDTLKRTNHNPIYYQLEAFPVEIDWFVFAMRHGFGDKADHRLVGVHMSGGGAIHIDTVTGANDGLPLQR